MKIVFIENRYKTRLYEYIASTLISNGIESLFLVQNKSFGVSKHKTCVIPYPQKENLATVSDKVKSFELEEKDRGFKFFNAGNKHYNYYYEQIRSFLTKESPSCVFGESTLFHELIAIEVCKELGITYLHPTSCRYPLGRMAFYEYDTLIPYNEKQNLEISQEDILLASSIAKREVVPEYMTQSVSKLQALRNKLHSSIWLTYSYLRGEKYNTPSPILKLKLNKELKSLKAAWEVICRCGLGAITDWKKTIVYPLQMQPEANLDVWGFPYNDQLKNIRILLQSMPRDWQLIVKPNPKSKFELTEELIDFISKEERCIAVSHNMKMDELFDKAMYFFAITGTICFECIFANKVAFSPSLPIVEMFAPQQFGFPNKPELFIDGNLHFKQDPSGLIAYLRKNSFKGIVSDHFHSNHVYTEENINDLSSAFYQTLKSLVS